MNASDLFTIIGAQQVDIYMLRAKVAELEAKVKELTASGNEDKKDV